MHIFYFDIYFMSYSVWSTGSGVLHLLTVLLPLTLLKQYLTSFELCNLQQ